ncbi:unnamed protein product, partial [Effrenium voratum]
MQEGGSFWATFGGAAGAPEASALEKLLKTPGCSVEALLDEEEVIQEFKTGNPSLVARLSEPDALKVLMDFITREPSPEASSARCFRYPFVAVELMTCAPGKFLDALNEEAMDHLWSFLSTTTPSKVNPVLAGYFSRTATALLGKQRKEILDYIRRKDQLEEFLRRIHLRSIAELFARLLSAENQSQVVFQTNDLMMRLMNRWQEQDADSDAQENITLVIAELLSQKDSLCWIEDLTQQLTSPNTVRFLIDHIFTRPSGVPPAMSLLTTVILHTAAGLKDGMTEACASTPTLSPLSPHATMMNEEDVVSLDEPAVAEAAASRGALSPPSTPQTTLRSATSEEWMERRRATLMREVAGHFPRLRDLLDNSLEEAPQEMTMPQGSIPAAGGTTLEVISLISTVARSGLDVILEAVLSNQLLPRCVEVFFRHPWSNLLHNSVKQLLLEVLSGGDSLRQQLVRQLLKEARLAERIVSEYAADAQWKKQRHERVGYMGHLFLLSCELQDYGSRCPEVGEILASTPGWPDVLARIDATQKVHREQLGGGVPASDRGLASSNVVSQREKEEATEQSAACPSWSQRVSGGYLSQEPTDLQDSSAPPPGVMNGLDVHAEGPEGPMPNGQGEHDGQPAPRELAVDTEPEEAFDSFDPGSPTAPRGAETQGTSQSNG